MRLAAAGQRILIGSRNADRAAAVAAQVTERAEAAAGGAPVSVTGGANADVAGAADVVIVAVPVEGHADTLRELAEPLAGKVVDCVVPMGWDDLGAYVVDVPEGSVTQQAAALLPDSTVIGAFHHLSAVLLEDLTEPTWTATSWLSATTARRWTWCRRWPAGCRGCAASTPAGCATPARSRRRRSTWSR